MIATMDQRPVGGDLIVRLDLIYVALRTDPVTGGGNHDEDSAILASFQHLFCVVRYARVGSEQRPVEIRQYHFYAHGITPFSAVDQAV